MYVVHVEPTYWIVGVPRTVEGVTQALKTVG